MAAQEIVLSTLGHQAVASEQHLNQCECNPGLEAAAATKNKIQSLKKLNKSDAITIKAMLWYYPKKLGVAKKVIDLHSSDS